MNLHRLIPTPAPQSPLPCAGGHRCPDLFQLDSGDIAVIGLDITEAAEPHLPSGSGCGPGERIVRIPRALLQAALAHLQSPHPSDPPRTS